MDRYSRGDDSAFDELYGHLAARLYGFLARQTDAETAQDLMQQAFMQVHRARGTFRPDGEVMPWAYAIARRLLIDAVRSAKSRPPVDCEAVPDLSESGDASPDEMIAAKQLANQFAAVLRKLPENQRIAWEMVRHEGLPLREVAVILDTTVSAIKLRVHRAYVALRAPLGDAVGPEPEGEES